MSEDPSTDIVTPNDGGRPHPDRPPAVARRRRGLDPARVARFVRRITPLVGLVCVVVLWLNFGWIRVPAGMDTTPSAPPGAICVVRKHPGPVPDGSLVFVRVSGGMLLSRVVAHTDDGVVIAHDDPDSVLPSSAQYGVIPFENIEAIVLSVLNGQPEAVPDRPQGGGLGGADGR